MEDNLQTIIGVIISVYIFFIFPVYMAYEKKDDVAYALAMRYTQDFANDVRNKGYITREMFESYSAKLNSTGNSYEINLTHKKTRMDPVTNYYQNNNGSLELLETTTQEERRAIENQFLEIGYTNGYINRSDSDDVKATFLKNVFSQNTIIQGNNAITKRIDEIVDTYLLSQEIYSTRDILDALATENKLWLKAGTEDFICVDDNEEQDLTAKVKKVKDCQYAYVMSANDEFNVSIKNTNITPATAIYNMITANTVDENTRIFVTYGGVILNEKWAGKIDYTKVKEDNFNIEQMKEKNIFSDNTKFEGASYFALGNIDNTKDYIVEFEVKPFEVTELRTTGYQIQQNEVSLYNLAIGGDYPNALGISVGLNGIALIKDDIVILSYPLSISGYKSIKVWLKAVEENINTYVAVLYVDGVRVAESSTLSERPKISYAGMGKIGRYTNAFSGYIKNLKVSCYEEEE